MSSLPNERIKKSDDIKRKILFLLAVKHNLTKAI